jgi:hypothetical protein
MGVIRGKIEVVDHLKIGKTLHPTPHTPHPTPRKNFFSRPYLSESANNKKIANAVNNYVKEN